MGAPGSCPAHPRTMNPVSPLAHAAKEGPEPLILPAGPAGQTFPAHPVLAEAKALPFTSEQRRTKGPVVEMRHRDVFLALLSTVLLFSHFGFVLAIFRDSSLLRNHTWG